jgi:hypothetical protein
MQHIYRTVSSWATSPSRFYLQNSTYRIQNVFQKRTVIVIVIVIVEPPVIVIVGLPPPGPKRALGGMHNEHTSMTSAAISSLPAGMRASRER